MTIKNNNIKIIDKFKLLVLLIINIKANNKQIFKQMRYN